jgi:gliding motility-associated protein GldL
MEKMENKKLFSSKKFKRFLSSLYSVGASIVVLGALFKIQHWMFADLMLTVGLITEAIIFFIYAFDNNEESSPVHSIIPLPGYGASELSSVERLNGDALAKLNLMLENSEINSEMFLKLGEGMKKLTEATENINSMGDVTVASSRYLKTIGKADQELEKTAKAYESVIANVTSKTIFKYKAISDSLLNIEKSSLDFQQHVSNMNKNMSELNEVYRLQQENSRMMLKEQTQLIRETNLYQEQMILLNQNMKAMNEFYSNMLAAMKTK